jgi:PEGA domain
MIHWTTADRLRTALLRGGMGVALVLVTRGAVAQRPVSNQAAADALYNQGRDLIKAGNTAAGCAKFEASLARSPAASTMLNIARCHEQDGKIATAFADYTRALGLNRETPGADRRAELEGLAQKGLRALEPRLPRLRVVIVGSPPGVEVKRDDEDLPAAALGEALPVDPGPHQVRVKAPGYRVETRAVSLEEGKTTVVEIALQATPAPTPEGAGRGWARPVGIALTTVGAVGLGVGAVTGILSLGKVHDIEKQPGCTHGPPCSTRDANDLTAAKTLGNVSTATFVAGGVLGAAGVVLLVLPASARVSVGVGRFDLRGSF